jgi:hypothetical protein
MMPSLDLTNHDGTPAASRATPLELSIVCSPTVTLTLAALSPTLLLLLSTVTLAFAFLFDHSGNSEIVFNHKSPSSAFT